ncbi:MAG: hypothetical protein ACRCZB_07145, partial [Bacteroidales bacterium]
QQLNAIIEKLPNDNLRKAYARTPVTDLTDEEFEALTGEITAEVEATIKETNAKGAVFGRPANTGGQVNENALSEEQKAAITQRSGVAKEGAQPF